MLRFVAWARAKIERKRLDEKIMTDGKQLQVGLCYVLVTLDWTGGMPQGIFRGCFSEDSVFMILDAGVAIAGIDKMLHGSLEAVCWWILNIWFPLFPDGVNSWDAEGCCTEVKVRIQRVGCEDSCCSVRSLKMFFLFYLFYKVIKKAPYSLLLKRLRVTKKRENTRNWLAKDTQGDKKILWRYILFTGGDRKTHKVF